MFGVKGTSILSSYVNIVKDTAIDYMHGVLEGVVKTMLHQEYNADNHDDGIRGKLKQKKLCPDFL